MLVNSYKLPVIRCISSGHLMYSMVIIVSSAVSYTLELQGEWTLNILASWLQGAWAAHSFSPAEAWNDEVFSQPCHRAGVGRSVSHLPRKQNLVDMHICLPRWENCHQP